MATRKNGAAMETKRYQFLNYKIAGWTYREIARQNSTSVSNVHKHVQTALKELADEHSEEADRLRDIQNSRYNTLLTRFWPQALTGDADALESVLKIMNNINKINGLEQKVLEFDQKVTNVTFNIDRTNINDQRDIRNNIHSAISVQETTGSDIQ